jgi:general L-amino acid transport system permease protein
MAATDSGTHGGSFRIGMLLTDTRYRSYTIQIFALFCLMLTAAWLFDNTVRNLQALGKDFSFAFLWAPAGYDISQRPIDYSSQMTHGRAAIVGLLNTLILAILSCALATVLGVLAGVARLSKNWVVARLMTVYVEMFRNIPLLVWILIFGAIFTNVFPEPRDFRGADPAASMVFGSFAATNRGIYIPEPVFARDLGDIFLGSSVTFGAFHLSISWSLLLVILLASFFANRALIAHATRVQNATGERPKIWWKSILILVAPAVLYLIALGLQWRVPFMPETGIPNFQGGIHMRSAFLAMWLGLGIYTGAFIAEIVRAGIMAISKGQTEASYALGLPPGKTMRLVILPQALRVIVPPLISQYLNITKNTSLGLAVGYMDLRSTLGGITINQTGRELEGMMLMMLTYLLLSLIISSLMNLYNSRVKLKER